MNTLDTLKAGDSFEDELFEGLDLAAFDFGGKEFFRCTFRNVKAQESVWRRARLEDCVFEDCDLTRAVTGDLRAIGVTFKGCKVMGVEWTKAALHPRLSFEECTLRYASFVSLSLRATPFLRCRLTEANFIDVDLTEADFSGSDLTGATFDGATLAGADLTTAKGAFLDPAKNRVKGARVAVETAVLLAQLAGMKVSGWDDEPEPAPAPKRGGRR